MEKKGKEQPREGKIAVRWTANWVRGEGKRDGGHTT